jgi:hypothetical protein
MECVECRGAQSEYRRAVDQEVGGSNPPSCTSEINDLEANPRRSFQDRYHLATTALALSASRRIS